MGCGCNKRQTVNAEGKVTSGTYRVMVSGRQVYESSNQNAAEAVAARFQTSTILAPGE